MSFFKQSLLRDALGAPAMESAEVVTEEVGSSASAQVEIERLKQENLDIMEIHALEQDVALIEKQGEGVEELSYALDEVGELKASMESYLEKGGMTAADAAGINRSLRFLNRRLGGALQINTPATESFQGATADRVTLTVAMEGAIGDFFKKIWEGIKNFFKRIKDTIMGWFGKSEEKLEKDKANLEEAAKKVEAKNELTVKEDNIALESVALDKDLAAGLKGEKIMLDLLVKHKLKEVESTIKLIEGLDKLVIYLSDSKYWDYIKGMMQGKVELKEEAEKYFAKYEQDVSAVLGQNKRKSEDEEYQESVPFLGNHVLTSTANMATYLVKYEIVQRNTSEESHILTDGSTASAKDFAKVLFGMARCIDLILNTSRLYSKLASMTDKYLNEIDTLASKSEPENKEMASAIANMSRLMVQNMSVLPVPRIAQIISNQNVRLMKIYNRVAV